MLLRETDETFLPFLFRPLEACVIDNGVVVVFPVNSLASSSRPGVGGMEKRPGVLPGHFSTAVVFRYSSLELFNIIGVASNSPHVMSGEIPK